MAHVNTVAVSGNLTRDPEVRWHGTSDDGKETAIVSLGIANNRRRYDRASGEYVESVSFFDVEVFGGFAVVVAKKMKKADAATITGRIDQQTWESSDGKRSKVVIVAEQIDSEAFFRSKDEDSAVVVTEQGGATTEAASSPASQPKPAAATPASDDIPF